MAPAHRGRAQAGAGTVCQGREPWSVLQGRGTESTAHTSHCCFCHWTRGQNRDQEREEDWGGDGMGATPGQGSAEQRLGDTADSWYFGLLGGHKNATERGG